MMTPDEKVLSAIVRLRNDPDFEVFEKWLEDSYMEELRLTAGMEDATHTRWSQGKCQMLSQLLEDVKTAPHTLEAIRNKG